MGTDETSGEYCSSQVISLIAGGKTHRSSFRCCHYPNPLTNGTPPETPLCLNRARRSVTPKACSTGPSPRLLVLTRSIRDLVRRKLSDHLEVRQRQGKRGKMGRNGYKTLSKEDAKALTTVECASGEGVGSKIRKRWNQER